MKTIGLIGGMSWESSAQYYAIINRAVRERLGAPHSACLLMISVDFAEIAELQHRGKWDELGAAMADAARALERGGADLVVLCTNTMHKVVPAIEAATALPLLHIVEPTAAAIHARGIRKVALLATTFTMEQDFYRTPLAERFGIETLIPDEADRREVHRIIYEELVGGSVVESSRASLRRIIARLIDAGAEGVILGCTELMLLVRPEDSAVPLFDTTELHALAAVERALA